MAFMGTKQRRDLVTNAQVLQEPIWPEDLTSDLNEASQVPYIHTICGFSLPCLVDSEIFPDSMSPLIVDFNRWLVRRLGM